MPFELIMGYTPIVHQPIRNTELPGLGTRISKITELRSVAQEALLKTQENLIKMMKFQPYDIGKKVWLESTNLKIPYESAKLSPKRYGPFKVAAIVSPVAYRLQLPLTWKIHPVFHASLLTPFRETEMHGPNFLEPPPVDIEGGEPEWEVEKILGDRIHRRKKQYLIRWKDYSPAHDEWVDESNLHANDLLSLYKQPQSASTSSNKNRTTNSRKNAKRPTNSIKTLYVNDIAPHLSHHQMTSTTPIDLTSSLPSTPAYLPSSLPPPSVKDDSDNESYYDAPVRQPTPYHDPSIRSADRHASPSEVGLDHPGGLEDDIHTPAAYTETWELAQAALRYYRIHQQVPIGAQEYSTEILVFATLLSPPTCYNELDEPNQYPYIHGALQAVKEELETFMHTTFTHPSSRSDSDKENQDIAIVEIAPTGPRSVREGGEPPVRFEDEGFERYAQGNRGQYPVTVFNFETEELEVLPWVRTYEEGPYKTMIEGTHGPGAKRYKLHLRPRPYPAPNFSNPGLFRDDYMEMYRENHQTRRIIDRA